MPPALHHFCAVEFGSSITCSTLLWYCSRHDWLLRVFKVGYLSARLLQVNCLLPGAVNTNFTNPVLGTKEQVEYILSRIPAGAASCI